MKPLALIVVGLALGAVLMYVFVQSGLNISFIKPTTSATPQVSDLPIVTVTQSPTSTPNPNTVVQAGGNPSTSFGKYQVSIPSNWTYEKQNNGGYEILVISEGNRSIKISQLASSGNVCVYPGDPDPGIPFKTEFSHFVKRTTADGTEIRESYQPDGDPTSMIVCALSQGNYQNPTPYGYISFKDAVNIPPQTYQDVVSILSSLKKI